MKRFILKQQAEDDASEVTGFAACSVTFELVNIPIAVKE
jgi:hypothetical protein